MPGKMIWWAVLLFVSLAGFGSAGYAQEVPGFAGTEHDVGSFTYGTYETDRGTVLASYRDVGRFRYGQFSDGGQSTSYSVGRFRYSFYAAPRIVVRSVGKHLRCNGPGCGR